jgi:hypothetical protein
VDTGSPFQNSSKGGLEAGTSPKIIVVMSGYRTGSTALLNTLKLSLRLSGRSVQSLFLSDLNTIKSVANIDADFVLVKTHSLAVLKSIFDSN